MGKKVKKKRKILWKSIIFFIVYMIFFMGTTSVLITVYGPFKNVKRTYVNTAMETMNHQYLATMFLSQKQIDKIRGKDNKNSQVQSVTQNVNDVTISKKRDDTIELREVHQTTFDGYILEIADPRRIKVGYTKKLGVRGQTTSEIVKAFGGIAGINGGGFSGKASTGKANTASGAYPEGIVISEGKVIFKNGAEDEEYSAIAFDKEGHLIVGKHTIQELLSMGVQEALSFEPTLIIGGKPQIRNDSGLNPRTAIAQKSDGHVLLLVIDGRKNLKAGASYKEVQNLLLQQGAYNAGLLDGGSSTTMYYDGDILNDPSDSSGERTVATAFYVTP